MTIRIGFLGTGIAASWHLENLVTMEGVEIAALCDTAPGKARETASRYGGQPYTIYEEMLDTERLDALYICLPPFAHAEQEVPAAERGIHLLVEKPVALDPAQGRRVAEAIARAGVISARAITGATITRSTACGRYSPSGRSGWCWGAGWAASGPRPGG